MPTDIHPVNEDEKAFLTPSEIGATRAKADRMEALWRGWAAFLSTEMTPAIEYQLTDPHQGNLTASDLSEVIRVYKQLRRKTHRDPTKSLRWPEALKAARAEIARP